MVDGDFLQRVLDAAQLVNLCQRTALQHDAGIWWLGARITKGNEPAAQARLFTLFVERLIGKGRLCEFRSDESIDNTMFILIAVGDGLPPTDDQRRIQREMLVLLGAQ